MENIWRAIERAKARDRVGGEGTRRRGSTVVARRRRNMKRLSTTICRRRRLSVMCGSPGSCVGQRALAIGADRGPRGDGSADTSVRYVANANPASDGRRRFKNPGDHLANARLRQDGHGCKSGLQYRTPGRTFGPAYGLGLSKAPRCTLPRFPIGLRRAWRPARTLESRRGVVRVKVGNEQLLVLPTSATTGSAELMASQAMAMLFQDLKRNYASEIIIVDLPPILSSDDVLAVLPLIDCVLLVVGVGTTKVSEIEECTKHLQSTEVVRIAVNKVPDLQANYYYY